MSAFFTGNSKTASDQGLGNTADAQKLAGQTAQAASLYQNALLQGLGLDQKPTL